MMFGDLDTLGGQIGPGTQRRTHRRLGTEPCPPAGSQLHAFPLDQERRPLGHDLADQLLHHPADGQPDRRDGREIGDLTEGDERHRHHRADRDIDGQLGVLDIGGPVFELLGEVFAHRDQTIQIAGAAAGDLLPVGRHRRMGLSTDRRQRGGHGLVGRTLQLFQRIGHLRPVPGQPPHRVLVTVWPMPRHEVQQEIRDQRRASQSHAGVPSLHPTDLVGTVLILSLGRIRRPGDLVPGRSQGVGQFRQCRKGFPGTTRATALRILLRELLTGLVVTPARPLRINPLLQLRQRRLDIVTQLRELRCHRTQSIGIRPEVSHDHLPSSGSLLRSSTQQQRRRFHEFPSSSP
ncbi:hypothetical protein [Nocardia terpenica]|uniref:hypothetical protein n=1 Tax=Nocardia terpenica TaxID=455432 RepID=UPI0012E78587|nr:hypothetical protein [Nocardia terpenica]NQE85863.1 hypothetical protein [Nocardia terpenica]